MQKHSKPNTRASEVAAMPQEVADKDEEVGLEKAAKRANAAIREAKRRGVSLDQVMREMGLK